MTLAQFRDILREIDHYCDGKYTLCVFVSGRQTAYLGSWVWLNDKPDSMVIVLTREGDFPPLYIPIEQITMITIKNGS
jgi:hypothetical protein